MAEENEVQQETERVTTKNPKKVEAGKRLDAHNHRQREKKREEQVQKTVEPGFVSELNQYYGIGAILAVGVIGGLGYYIYRTKKGPTSREVKDVSMPHNPSVSQQPCPQTNKFEMDYISSVL